MFVQIYVLNEVGRKVFDRAPGTWISSKKAGFSCWQCKDSPSKACALPLTKLACVTVTTSHSSFLVFHLSVWQVAALPILACEGDAVLATPISTKTFGLLSCFLFNDDSLFTCIIYYTCLSLVFGRCWPEIRRTFTFTTCVNSILRAFYVFSLC